MVWYLEKETAWWRAEFNGNDVEIRIFDGANETQEIRQHASQEVAMSATRQLAAQYLSMGYVERTPPESRWKPEPEVAAWYDKEFFKGLAAKPLKRDRGLRHTLAADHNVTFPPDLARFLEFRDTHAFGYTNFAEWRIWDTDLELPDFGTPNRFERLILLDQNNYLGTAMAEAFMSGVYLGSLGNGDSYLATQANDPDQWEIIFWDHEEGGPSFAFADSVSTLAYVNHLLDQTEGDDLDPEGFQQDARRVADRASLSWHFGNVTDESGVDFEYERRGNAMYYHWRMVWVNYLLRQNGVVDVEDLPPVFFPQYHDNLTFEDVIAHSHIRNTPATQYYWMWRLFWFNKVDQLAQVLDLCDAAPSPLVRDCAALIRELQGGRKTLGKIEDIQALRERFLALDLDPERKAEREAEQARAAELAEASRTAANAAAAAAVASLQGADLIAKAWELVAQPEAVAQIYQTLAAQDEDIAWAIKRVEFLRDQKATRNGRYYGFEVEEVKRSLGERVEKVLPLVLSTQKTDAVGILAHSASPRALEHLLTHLDATDYTRASAAGALGSHVARWAPGRSAEIAQRLIEVGNGARWKSGDYMAAISSSDLLRGVLDSLGALHTDTSLDFLIDVATEGPTEMRVPAVKAAARVARRTGAEHDALYDVLALMLTNEEARPALFSLAVMGSARAHDVVEQHLATKGGLKKNVAFETAMRQWTKARAGLSYDFDAAFWAFDLVMTNKYLDAELHEALIGLLLLHPDVDWANERLRDYLHYGNFHVARLAEDALVSRDAFVPFLVDRVLAEDVAAAGADAVAQLLAEPDALWKHNLLRVVADFSLRSESLERAAATCVAAICRPRYYAGGYVSSVYPSVNYALEAAEALNWEASNLAMATALSFGSPYYAKPLEEATVIRLKALIPEDAVEKKTFGYRPLAVNPWVVPGAIHGLATTSDNAYLVATNVGLYVLDAGGFIVGNPMSGWLFDVVVCGNVAAVCGHSGQFALFDLDTWKPRNAPGLRAGVRKARFSPDGSKVIVVSDGRYARFIDVATGEASPEARDNDDINGVDWLDDQTVVWCTDKTVAVVGIDGTEHARLRVGAAAEVRVKDGLIYVGGPKGIVVLDRDLRETGTLLKQAKVARMAFSGDTLFAASWEGKDAGISAWNLKTTKRKKLKTTQPVHGFFGMCLDGDGVVAGGNLRVVLRWDGKHVERPFEFKGHRDEIAAIVPGRDGRAMSVSDDRTVVEWEVSTGAVTGKWSVDFRSCHAQWDVELDLLYVTGTDTTVALTATGEERWRAEHGHRSEYLALCGEHVVVAAYNSLAWLDRRTGEIVHQTDPFADSFIFHWVNLDPERIVCAGYDDVRLFVWNLRTRTLERTVDFDGGPRDRLRFIAKLDSDRVVATRTNNVLQIFDVTQGHIERTVALAAGKVAFDQERGRIYAWMGAETYTIDGDGNIDELGTSTALETVTYLGGRLLGGTKAGDVVVFE